MATHDYVISNASGASVRADLNNALAAIVSNNSNATSPATTYAYQWWADTTTGQLKLRNSANSAWITLRELDGTLLMEEGSVSAPGLAFAVDLDTGFFRSAADKLNIATGGAERLEIGSSEVVFNDPSNDVDLRVESNGNTHMLFVEGGTDRVGIGESDPDQTLHISEAASGTTMGVIIHNTATADDSDARLTFNTNSGGAEKTRAYIQATGNTSGSGNLVFATRKSGSTSESARIDSSGRFLLGTSNPRENFYQTTNQNWQHQIEGTNYLASGQAQITNSNDALGAYLNFAKSRGTSVGSNTIVNDSDDLGVIDFHGNDGTDFVHAARIVASVDGAPGGNDMPGRITFLTTADNGTSPTERLRIDRAGSVGIDFTPKRMHSNVTSSLNVGSSSLFQRTNDSFITSNFYYNTSDVGKSIASGYGVMYSQNTADGRHNFNVSAASAGSADATHSLQTKVIIDNDGLKFNGDTAAANALDDYEEGSWTPAVYSGGYSAITVVSAKYTKIGNLVNVQCYADGYIGTGSSVSLVLQGLPFDSLNNGYAPGSVDFGKGGVKGTYSRTESDNDRISFIYPSEANAGRINLKGNQIYNDAYTILNLTYITDE